MKAKYISYHSFNWPLGRWLFIRSLVKAGGEVIEQKKKNGKYTVKVNNPEHHMNNHKKWYRSNVNFFKTSL